MLNKNRKVEILDTTLRDGSYTIGYQFNAKDTAIIARGLELSGINRIEIGHGLGLGADRAGKGAQSVPDYIYMQACRNVLKKSVYGFFYIPEIGTIEDIELLAGEGGKFIRIGISPNDIQGAITAVRYAKKSGLEVWINMMKSYAYPVDVCIECSTALIDNGADGVYVVDSAGGMLPNEVARYVGEISNALINYQDVPLIGFHGHENLGLGLACSLSAVQAGCNIVDGSLLGIGRSMGNTSTEGLAMVLSRANIETGVDPWQVADLAEKLIRPFLESRWRNSSLEQALGFAQIHSGFLTLLKEVATLKNVNLRDLVLALGVDARDNITRAMAEAAADLCPSKNTHESSEKLHASIWKYKPILAQSLFTNYSSIHVYLDEIIKQSKRLNKQAVLILTGIWGRKKEHHNKFQQVRIFDNAVIGSIEVTESVNLETILRKINGVIDVVFLDQTPRGDKWNKMLRRVMATEYSSLIVPYADELANLIACCRLIAIEAQKRKLFKIVVLGNSERSQLIMKLLPFWGISIEKQSSCDFMILVDHVDFSQINIDDNLLIFDLLSGSLNPSLCKTLNQRGIEIIRPDGRSAIIGEVVGMFEGLKLVNEIMGRFQAEGMSFVAGGLWGDEGEIIVDSSKNPQNILGIADGKGMLKTKLSQNEEDKLAAAEQHLNNLLIRQIFSN